MPNSLTRYSVLRLAVVSEGVLALLALGWVYLADLSLPLELSYSSLLWGLLGAAPMLLVNFGIIEPLYSKTTWYIEFRDGVIYPLCRDLSPITIIIISLMSGLCEELFFRGALQFGLTPFLGVEGAIIGASILFSAMHFGPALFRFHILGAIYLLAGLYLSAIIAWSGSLVSAMLVHATYNFIAMSVIRRRIRRSA